MFLVLKLVKFESCTVFPRPVRPLRRRGSVEQHRNWTVYFYFRALLNSFLMSQFVFVSGALLCIRQCYVIASCQLLSVRSVSICFRFFVSFVFICFRFSEQCPRVSNHEILTPPLHWPDRSGEYSTLFSCNAEQPT